MLILSKECTAIDLLKRPNMSSAQIAEFTGSEVSEQVGEQIEMAVYAGYINRQHEDVAQMKRLEETQIPADFKYDGVSGLSREITLKLKNVRPETLAQASRTQGVTPAAVQLMMITIRKNAQAKKSAKESPDAFCDYFGLFMSLTAIAPSMEVLYAARFFTGLGLGAAMQNHDFSRR